MMLLYNNVAGLRHFLGAEMLTDLDYAVSAARPDNLYIEIANLLSQRVAIKSE